jgi:hypothetical protein
MDQRREGSASDLLAFLASSFAAEDRGTPKDWPDTPERMAGRLKRLARSLRALGWTVEQGSRTRRQRIRLIEPPQADRAHGPHSVEYQPQPSPPSSLAKVGAAPDDRQPSPEPSQPSSTGIRSWRIARSDLSGDSCDSSAAASSVPADCTVCGLPLHPATGAENHITHPTCGP